MPDTVKRGDTLSAIAARNHTTVEALLRANPTIKNPNQIYPGQTIVLPNSKPSPAPVPPPATAPSQRQGPFTLVEGLYSHVKEEITQLVQRAWQVIDSKFSKHTAHNAPVMCCPPPAPSAAPPALALGKNEAYRTQILLASKRTGLDPAAVASIIDAEAAKTPEGVWDSDSAAQTSSARGLTQFLKGTWLEMARKPGTLLNQRAKEQGLIGQDNKVVSGKQEELLKLRNNPELSIITGAEYAKSNLDYLHKQNLIPAGATDDEKARLAYIAHHEGPDGARKLLNNTLDEKKAEQLLKTNVGEKKAEELKAEGAETGSWAKAYKDWLMDYTEKKIVPDRFRPPKPQTPHQSEPPMTPQQLL